MALSHLRLEGPNGVLWLFVRPMIICEVDILPRLRTWVRLEHLKKPKRPNPGLPDPEVMKFSAVASGLLVLSVFQFAAAGKFRLNYGQALSPQRHRLSVRTSYGAFVQSEPGSRS